MKKILIVNNNMKVGGVQKSLHNLLWAMNGSYDMTLLLFRNVGAYAGSLPPGVKVVECSSLFRLLGVSQSECSGVDRLKRGLLVAISRLFGRPMAMKIVLASQKMLTDSYDCAISFLHNGSVKNFYGGTQEFVLHRVRAKKKVAFLHCDYGHCGANHRSNNQLISQFDAIAACSDGCRRAFETVLPELKQKTVTVCNCHRVQQICEMAEEIPVVYDDNFVNVVMVSRLAHEKGIERAIEAVAVAAEGNVPVVLHIIGDGPMREQLQLMAKERSISQRVSFYGEQANPYRYMKNADLLLMTSYHEAAPMVIEEAGCLALPVLTVRTTSSEEMVMQRECGWVCENDQQSINTALIAVVCNKEALEEKKRLLQKNPVDNKEASRQFREMIEE